MIISTEEISGFEGALRAASDAIERFIGTHPHLLFPAGFDEVRLERISALPGMKIRYRAIDLAYHAGLTWDDGRTWCYRLRDSGAWCYVRGISWGSDGTGLARSRLTFWDGSREIEVDVTKAFEACKRIAGGIIDSRLILPAIWIPPVRIATAPLTASVSKILHQIRAERTSLQKLPWRLLEELVGELLRDMGFAVELTPPSRDGGRDIIARGELIPGEPCLLAVEVKRRDVVRLEDVRAALYANRDFPGLLIATSGRFSAGVVREKSKPENVLRLFLKDGVALNQWIRAYPRSKGTIQIKKGPSP